MFFRLIGKALEAYSPVEQEFISQAIIAVGRASEGAKSSYWALKLILLLATVRLGIEGLISRRPW